VRHASVSWAITRRSGTDERRDRRSAPPTRRRSVYLDPISRSYPQPHVVGCAFAAKTQATAGRSARPRGHARCRTRYGHGNRGPGNPVWPAVAIARWPPTWQDHSNCPAITSSPTSTDSPRAAWMHYADIPSTRNVWRKTMELPSRVRGISPADRCMATTVCHGERCADLVQGWRAAACWKLPPETTQSRCQAERAFRLFNGHSLSQVTNGLEGQGQSATGRRILFVFSDALASARSPRRAGTVSGYDGDRIATPRCGWALWLNALLQARQCARGTARSTSSRRTPRPRTRGRVRCRGIRGCERPYRSAASSVDHLEHVTTYMKKHLPKGCRS